MSNYISETRPEFDEDKSSDKASKISDKIILKLEKENKDLQNLSSTQNNPVSNQSKIENSNEEIMEEIDLSKEFDLSTPRDIYNTLLVRFNPDESNEEKLIYYDRRMLLNDRYYNIINFLINKMDPKFFETIISKIRETDSACSEIANSETIKEIRSLGYYVLLSIQHEI